MASFREIRSILLQSFDDGDMAPVSVRARELTK